MNYKPIPFNSYLALIFLLFSTFYLAHSYIDTYEDCLKVATKFPGTCGTNILPISDWNQFPSQWVQCQNVGVCPDGTNSTFCYWQRKLCVTCSLENNIPFIRIQTNGLPTHCFNTSTQVSPIQLDYKVRFNYMPRFGEDLVTFKFSDQNALNNQMCQSDNADSLKIPVKQFFQNFASNFSIESIVGVAISGAPIYTPVSNDNVDPFFPQQWSGFTGSTIANQSSNSTVMVLKELEIKDVDRCLGNVYPKDKIYHYHVMSPCWFDPSIPAGQCRSDNQCATNLTDYMLTTFENNKTQKVVGLAKDGRVIYGPYKQDSTLWRCEDVDQCNGRMMEDGSYAYLSTQFFPYFIGCWGPGPNLTMMTDCTSNACFGMNRIKEFVQKIYLKEFKKRLEQYTNHPLHNYQPQNFKFLSQGGQSKVLQFYSETLKTDLVIKIYPGKFSQEAENEFNNIQLLDHENIIRVWEIGTIVEEKIQNQDKVSENSLSDTGAEEIKVSESPRFQVSEDEALELEKKQPVKEELYEIKNEDEKWQSEDADYFIIMEKADKSLLEEISKRRFQKKPYTAEELMMFWATIVNVFAYCQFCGITHNDIKPSNILMCRTGEEEIPKVSDFGTSINIEQRLNRDDNDGLMTNLNKFITPLYASPNVCNNEPKINYFLEDVFSLGVTFIQMAGLFSSQELLTYNLNQKESRLQNAFENSQTKLPYFHRAILQKMLAYEADDRLNFIQLKEVFECPQLDLNLENIEFVNALVSAKINPQAPELNKEMQNTLQEKYFTQTMFRQDNTLVLTRGRNEIGAMQIRNLQNNVTRLISGNTKFEPLDFCFTAKAISQSEDLIVFDHSVSADSGELQAKLYKPIDNDISKMHYPRPNVFSSECQTIITHEGQIYVIGGRYQEKYIKSVYEIFLNHGKGAKEPLMQNKKPPIRFRFKKNIGFYGIKSLKDMSEGKSNLAHFTTSKEIFIAGGSSSRGYGIANVESYDIKRDAWKFLPSLNHSRTLAGLCLFRQRFLYAFGGQNEEGFVKFTERLDVREGTRWETLKVQMGCHSVGVCQITTNEILIFGSYFEENEPVYGEIKYQIFDHDKQSISDQTQFYEAKRGLQDQYQMQVGSFTDSITTNKQVIYAYDSYTSTASQNLSQIKMSDLKIQQ